jgi:hypothetical protein
VKIKLNLSFVKDPDLSKSLEIIEEYLNAQSFLRGQFRFYEIVLPGAVTNYRFSHNLGFAPKDVIVTSVVGSSPTWNYTRFDSTAIDITTAGASTIRAFIGRYGEN